MPGPPTPTWIFDVDGCVIDSLTGSSLRPGSADLLAHLRSTGCRLILWSAGGAAYAERRARQQGIDAYFESFHGKDERDRDGRYRPTSFDVDLASAVFVDDRPEDMPLGADVIAVAPYLAANPHDRGLAPASERAGATVPG